MTLSNDNELEHDGSTSTSMNTSNSTPMNSGLSRHDQSTPITLDSDDNEEILKSSRLTLVVWNHYKRQKINDTMKPICNYCGKKLGGESRNGIKHLHNHFKNFPLRRQRDIRQSCLKPTKINKEKLVLNSALFDYEASRRDLACAIILH